MHISKIHGPRSDFESAGAKLKSNKFFRLSRGGDRGGLGGYSPHRSMLAPRGKVNSDFFGDFWDS